MATATVKIPSRMDLASAFDFAKELDYYCFHDSLTIDFSEKTFFAPFSMLLIASKLKFLSEKYKVNLRSYNYNNHDYLAHMGFFRMFGWNYGRDVGEAWGSQNYLPITKIDRGSFYENPTDKYHELPDLIQRNVDRIALVISRDREKNPVLFDVLSYSIREIMRNVFEHSRSDSLYFAAQYWPNSSKVEFAISDFGVGIRRGLAENPNFAFDNDKDAIELSLMPSVSGKTHLPRTSENWFNSGYGLYMTSRFARSGGNFVIASNSKAVHLSRRTKSNYNTSFPGTIIRFNIDARELFDVKSMLDQFRKEGNEIAKTISGTGSRPPSAMSLILRRDFKLYLHVTTAGDKQWIGRP